MKVHVLAEAVGVEQKGPAQTPGKRREGIGGDLHGQFVPVSHDDEAVVHLSQKLGNRAVAGESAGVGSPVGVGVEAVVVVTERERALDRSVLRVAAPVQVGGLDAAAVNGDRACGDIPDQDLVEVNGRGSGDSHLPDSRRQGPGEVDEHPLGQPRGHPHVGDRRPPAAGPVRNLQPRGRELQPRLRRGPVRGRVGVVDPAVGQQGRALHSRQVAEVEKQRELAGVAVNAQALEAVVPVVVDMLEQPEDVVAAVVAGGHGRAQSRQCAGLELRVRGRRQQALVRVHLQPGGMVDGDQLGGVEVDDLLELVGRLQDVAPILRHQLPDAHVLVVVRGVVLAGGREVADDATPEEVGHEAEAAAVPGVEDGAGGPLAVELHQVEALSARGRQLRLPHPAGPEDADEFDGVGRSQAEGQTRGGAAAAAQLPLLLVAPGLHLHLCAETVEVAVQAAQPDADPASSGGGVGVQLAVRPDVDVAVAVEVFEQDQLRCPSRAQLRSGRPEGAAGPLQETDASLSKGDEIEVAVVVDVGGADAAPLPQGDFIPSPALETAPPPVLEDADLSPLRYRGDVHASVRIQVADADVRNGSAPREPAETAVGGPVGESPVPVVCVELHSAAVGENEEVDVAVVVEVGENRLPGAPLPDPGRGRDVGESCTAVVAQQARAAGP